MWKHKYLLLSTLFLALCAISCSKNSGDTPRFPKEISYKVVAERTLSKKEFLDSLKSSFINEDEAFQFSTTVPDDISFDALTVNYVSTDQRGQDVTLSGLVIIPKVGGKFTAKGMVLNNRATQIADTDVPSRHWNQGTIMAARNYVFVSSDLIGFGASVDRPVNFCCYHLAGRNTLDLVIAVQQILHEESRGLGLGDTLMPFYNTGYSQGGYSALAVHRYWECDASPAEKAMAPLQRSYCGAGPYSIKKMMEFHFQNGISLYTPYLVLGLMSAMDYHPELFEGYRAEDFLTDKAKEMRLVEMIREKKTGNIGMIAYVLKETGIEHSLDYVFKADALNPEGELYKVLSANIDVENVLEGWAPSQRKATLFHAYMDDCVPSACTMAAEEAFKSSNMVDFVWNSDELKPFLHATVEKYFNGWMLDIL